MGTDEQYDLAGKVIGCAMEIHKTLGPGFLENDYETALAIELNEQKIPHEKQKELIVKYKGQTAGTYRADLFINQEIIIEIKATQNLNTAHEAQLVNYLTATNTPEGLLLNFGATSLSSKRNFSTTNQKTTNSPQLRS